MHHITLFTAVILAISMIKLILHQTRYLFGAWWDKHTCAGALYLNDKTEEALAKVRFTVLSMLKEVASRTRL